MQYVSRLMMIYESCNHNNNLLKYHCTWYKFSPTCFIGSMKASLMDHFKKLFNVFHKLVAMKSDPKKMTLTISQALQ